MPSAAAPLGQALRRLEVALAGVEAAVARRLNAERGRSDLEIELEVMQDDRARLATELDGTLARLRRVEAASGDVERRLGRAIGAVRVVLDGAGAGGSAGGPVGGPIGLARDGRG